MTDQICTQAHATTPAPAQPDRPRIDVACLAAQKSGCLQGRWITPTTPDEISTHVCTMLAHSLEPDAEEWPINGYQGFEGANLSEYASFETVCELADFIEEHCELGGKLLSHFGDDLARRAAFEGYAGEYRSAADFAESPQEDTRTQIPESLRHYIDRQALAHDMPLNGEIIVCQRGFDEVQIFWSRQGTAWT